RGPRQKQRRRLLARRACRACQGQHRSLATAPIWLWTARTSRSRTRARLEHKDGALSLHFTVSFDPPIPANVKGFAYVFKDPAFYIAFLPAKTDPVRLGQGRQRPARRKLAIRRLAGRMPTGSPRPSASWQRLSAPPRLYPSGVVSSGPTVARAPRNARTHLG